MNCSNGLSWISRFVANVRQALFCSSSVWHVLAGTFQFSQRDSMQTGPSHQSGSCRSCEGRVPLEARSAGFSNDFIYCHRASENNVRISLTLLLTNVFHRDGWPKSQARTTWESNQQNVPEDSSSSCNLRWATRRARSSAPYSSSLGMLTVFTRATFVLAASRVE